MFKKERIKNLKMLVDSYKEIDKKIVDIKVAIHDLEKLSYSEDIDFLESLAKQLDNMNIEFYKLKQEIIKKVEKIWKKVLDMDFIWYNMKCKEQGREEKNLPCR